MSPFATTLRRFSRSSTRNKEPLSPAASHSQAASTGQASIRSSGASAHDHPYISSPMPQHSVTGTTGIIPMPSNNVANEIRPISSGTEGSFDFANRPLHHHRSIPSTASATMPVGTTVNYSTPGQPRSVSTAAGGLSRTDKIVLQHFWETKYQENSRRDLHYLKFPFFPQYPSHGDLLPYCEIYHLIKTSPGATIISLGSINGIYIGFELQAGSQLHIDMDDEWHNIAHYRVHFKSYDAIIRDPNSEAIFKTWPKPLTIEFLEEEYQKWCLDLTSLCWEGKEVRELGSVPHPSATMPSAIGGTSGGTLTSNGNNSHGGSNGHTTVGSGDGTKRF